MRTVSVNLELETAGYKAEAAEAAAVTKVLGHEFDGLGTSAKSFSTSKPTKEMQNFSRVIDSSLKDGKTAFESISQSIDDTRTHITKLKEEIRTTTGNPTSLFGDLKSAKNDLRTLEKLFKDITPELEQSGTQGGNAFLQGFSSAMKSSVGLGPAALTFGIGLAAIATPVVVSALTAAVAGGVGAGNRMGPTRTGVDAHARRVRGRAV